MAVSTVLNATVIADLPKGHRFRDLPSVSLELMPHYIIPSSPHRSLATHSSRLSLNASSLSRSPVKPANTSATLLLGSPQPVPPHPSPPPSLPPSHTSQHPAHPVPPLLGPRGIRFPGVGASKTAWRISLALSAHCCLAFFFHVLCRGHSPV